MRYDDPCRLLVLASLFSCFCIHNTTHNNVLLVFSWTTLTSRRIGYELAMAHARKDAQPAPVSLFSFTQGSVLAGFTSIRKETQNVPLTVNVCVRSGDIEIVRYAHRYVPIGM